uniref:Uncharacterized protein n=1 Tax=Timema cristinae TaxID=61476 RepID=A0A7R9CTN3_TIMCR|nr:unnamed protein product [Timema cristinae]
MQGKFDELLASDVDYAQLLSGGDDGQLDAGKGFGAESDEKNQQLPRLLRQISRASTKSKASTVPDDVDEPEETEVQQQLFEASSKGKSERSVYAEYFCSGANCLGLFLMSSFFVVAQAAASGADYWMSFWVTQEELRSYYQSPEFQYDLNTTKNNASAEESEIFLLTVEDLLSTQLCLYIYTGIVVFLIVIAFVRSFTFYTVCMRSSVSLHNDMFNSVIRTPVRFFDVNPSGRVLNRFAKDIGSVDELLPKSLMDASQTMFIMLGSLVVGVTVSYWFIIPILLLGSVLLIMRSIYLRTSKNVKRVEGITKSPVFTHMNATLQGLSTIRAYGAQKILQQEFDKHQDVHSSAFYMFITTSSAFGFFVDFICFIYISLVTFSFLVLQEMYGGSVGLAITQAMALAGVVQFGIRQTAEVANNMMSVERVAEYKYLQEEPNLESNKDAKPPKDWPFEGEIEFQNVYLKYVETEPPVLKDLNLVINPGEKVGIVGRTGAGKSSLISALFRLFKVEGTLKIDGVDTSLIGLEDLRSRISIIPQDPFLFSGTLRRNLDPFSEFDDDALWRALEEVELKETYKEGQGLSMGVTDGGGNVSVGQRQLICLARAILRNNKILLLDEATANVDPQTDELIQKTIRTKFAKCTVLTVAHRLHTIMDSNKVLVMDSGRMIEFDHPHRLLQKKEGHFSKMVQETGFTMAAKLSKIAEDLNIESILFPTPQYFRRFVWAVLRRGGHESPDLTPWSPANVNKGVHDAISDTTVGMGESVIIAGAPEDLIQLSRDERPDMVRRTWFVMRGLAPSIKRRNRWYTSRKRFYLYLDNAGKTTIVKRFNGEAIDSISPTLGFNIKTIEHKGFMLNIWDVGGQKSLRSYWRNYFESTDGLIWVVDCADKRRLDDCRKELHELLQEEILELNMIKTHNWKIVGCSAVTGDNLVAGIDWLVSDISSRIFTLD